MLFVLFCFVLRFRFLFMLFVGFLALLLFGFLASWLFGFLAFGLFDTLVSFYVCFCLFVKRVLIKSKKACLQESQKNKKIKKGRSSVCPREEEDTKKKKFFLECFSPQTNKHTQTTHFLYSFFLGEDTF